MEYGEAHSPLAPLPRHLAVPIVAPKDGSPEARSALCKFDDFAVTKVARGHDRSLDLGPVGVKQRDGHSVPDNPTQTTAISTLKISTQKPSAPPAATLTGCHPKGPSSANKTDLLALIPRLP